LIFLIYNWLQVIIKNLLLVCIDMKHLYSRWKMEWCWRSGVENEEK